MNDIQIAATIFVASLVCGLFHFSGYVAAKGVARDGNWTAFGAMPLICASAAAVISLLIMIGLAFIYQPPTP
jgi:hypothetical protein